jgi:hypothetical protein
MYTCLSRQGDLLQCHWRHPPSRSSRQRNTVGEYQKHHQMSSRPPATICFSDIDGTLVHYCDHPSELLQVMQRPASHPTAAGLATMSQTMLLWPAADRRHHPPDPVIDWQDCESTAAADACPLPCVPHRRVHFMPFSSASVQQRGATHALLLLEAWRRTCMHTTTRRSLHHYKDSPCTVSYSRLAHPQHMVVSSS